MTAILKYSLALPRVTIALLLVLAIGFKVLATVVYADVKKDVFSINADNNAENGTDADDQVEKLQEWAQLNQSAKYTQPVFTTIAHHTAYQNSYISLYFKLITIPPPDLS